MFGMGFAPKRRSLIILERIGAINSREQASVSSAESSDSRR
jgi:hypothetical protein